MQTVAAVLACGLVLVSLGCVVCQTKLGNCNSTSFPSSVSTGENICIPTHQIATNPDNKQGELQSYNDLAVNVGNLDEDVRLDGGTDLGLEICVRREAEGGGSIIVTVRNESNFDGLAGGTLKITNGNVPIIVRFYGPGMHALNATFRISEIMNVPVVISSVALVNGEILKRSELNVCEVIQNGNVTTYAKSTHFKVSTNRAETCTAFNKGWLSEVRIEALDSVTFNHSKYMIVVSNVSCGDISTGAENYTSPRITLLNDNVTGTDTNPTSTTASNPTDASDEGLSGGAIAGIAVVVCLVAATIVITSVIMLAVGIYRRKGMPETGHRPSTSASTSEQSKIEEGQAQFRENHELSTQQQLVGHTDDNETPVMDGKIVYVCDKAPHDSSKIIKLLAQQEDANLESLDDGGLSIATIRNEHCVRGYIIIQESIERLKEHCQQVWTFIRDVTTRPLPPSLLSKVVLIRLYETHNDAVADFIEGPVLTVNIHKDKWLKQPDKCAKLIVSKVKLHQKQIAEDVDGNLSQSGTPPTDTIALNPPETPRTVHNSPPPQTQANLVETLHEIKDQLIGIREATQKTAEHTGKTAENTGGLAETVEEVRHQGIAISDVLLQERLDDEAPDND